jgi:RNA polymerase sigma-70 factor, ECF subfamily
LESQAFRELALTEMDSVYRMAMHLARNPEDASDLVQDTYLKAFKAEGRFELRESGVRPWLFKILHNNFYTRVGRKNREPMLSDDLSYQPGKGGDPSEAAPAWDLAHLDWEQVDDRLKQAIHGLPDHYREVLLLWAVEGLKYREVAEVLDVPLGTVMSRLYRARSILAGLLGGLAAEHGIKPGDADS